MSLVKIPEEKEDNMETTAEKEAVTAAEKNAEVALPSAEAVKIAEESQKAAAEEEAKPKVNAETGLPIADHKRYHDLAMKSAEYVLTNGCRFTSEGKQLNVDNKKNALERYVKIAFSLVSSYAHYCLGVFLSSSFISVLFIPLISSSHLAGGSASCFRR
jgi:hypothetical protein